MVLIPVGNTERPPDSNSGGNRSKDIPPWPRPGGALGSGGLTHTIGATSLASRWLARLKPNRRRRDSVRRGILIQS
jgi:hypothetical protein